MTRKKSYRLFYVKHANNGRAFLADLMALHAIEQICFLCRKEELCIEKTILTIARKKDK